MVEQAKNVMREELSALPASLGEVEELGMKHRS